MRLLPILLYLFAATSYSQDVSNMPNIKVNSKDSDSWSAQEYSGLRGEKEIRTAFLSKGFTWITGSPADNEKLSIGKNAQFFGFVALRYQSGRAANRGALGRAMFALASDDQRDVIAKAVQDELTPLKQWWQVRNEILTLLEDHLYTGLPIDQSSLIALGEQFSYVNSEVAIHEARAYAAFENMMSDEQRQLVARWRSNPELASEYADGTRVKDDRVTQDDYKLLEDLYAKCFAWISGTKEDNEIIPIGQPAQFFGFVALRHKSGHGANRGEISKHFNEILDSNQRGDINDAVEEQMSLVREFLETRHDYLNQLASLRSNPANFDKQKADQLAHEMGQLEMKIATVEAQAYRKIRISMSEQQIQLAMALRGNYIVDEAHIATMNTAERGASLSVLCSGCHGVPNAWREGMIGPSLDGFWDRPIASLDNFEFSNSLADIAKDQIIGWTPDLLDQFLTNPKLFAPGTKMEFQGLLSSDDRQAIIQHLQTSR